jgi:peptide/nickel transport system substrate-binding protein
VTSGPFKIASHTADQRITMVPNPYYRSTTLHQSVLDQLIFTEYRFDVDALIAAFQTGQTDFTDSGLLFNDLPRISGIPGYRLSRNLAYASLEFNLSRRPVLQDVTVRKAIEEAIDRCAMIQTLYQQPCDSLRVDTILPAPSPAYDATITTYGYDLAEAKQDMLIAGWDCSNGPCTRNGKPFPALTLVTFAARFHKTAEVIQQDLATLGIPVELDGHYTPTEVFDTYTNGGILAQGRYDLSVFISGFDLDPDPDLYPSFHSSQIPSASNSAGQNYERVNDPNINSLLEQGRVTLERAERMRLYKDLQRDLVKDVYVVPLYLRPNVVLVNPHIGNYQDNPTDAGNLWNVGDWFLTQ